MIHRSFVRIVVVLLLSIFCALTAQAAKDTLQPQNSKRLAIVIGNSNYQSARLPHLANASNDATKLSESLKRLNFDVLTGTDLTSQGFAKLFSDADARLPSVGSVLIFYAGHGVQLRGENYLLPVDVPDVSSLPDLTAASIKLNDVIARFSNRNRQTFIFLDACRNNPMGKDDNARDGLAQVDVGENTFVAFATQPGNITLDGSGDNSPFTTALLKNIEIPGLSISDMMIRVRNETESLTLGRQVPWDQSNLREQFYFTEQQVLDPAQLSASLSRILADPAAKQKLQLELASNDLQTAVLIVGQTLRSVDASATDATPVQSAGTPAQPAGVQVASLEGAKQSVASGLQTLIVGTTPNETDASKKTDLARSAQAELRRLGCYRSTVNGIWGKTSVKALSDYYRNTGQAGSSTDPTVDLLSDLFLHSGRICKQPVIVQKVKPQHLAVETPAIRKTVRPSGPRPGGSPSSRPAAPPPDISGGIGIGGVF